MKGIIFNLLETVVSDEYGENTWDQLLEDKNLSGSYTSLGTYPDQELLDLVDAASNLTKIPPFDLIRWFGLKAGPLLIEKYPNFAKGHKNSKEFLLTLNDIIHPEVRKVYPEADVPDFEYKDDNENSLTIFYESKKKLCSLAEGLILGAGVHFDDNIKITQHKCMLNGDPKCEIFCEFS